MLLPKRLYIVRDTKREAERLGVSFDFVDAALADSGWREVAETNRADLFARAIWGVPAFRVDDGPVLWGQDRLWMVEEHLIRAVKAGAS